MNTKLTLRIDDALIETAKSEASRRGKSVSRMAGEFFDFLSEANYKKHLRKSIIKALDPAEFLALSSNIG